MLAFGRRDDQPTFHQSPARRIFHTMSSSRPTHGTFNEIGLLQSVQDDEWIRRSLRRFWLRNRTKSWEIIGLNWWNS